MACSNHICDGGQNAVQAVPLMFETGAERGVILRWTGQ